MKKLLVVFALLGSVIAFNSCKEEIDLIGNFQETAVVYGLIDQADTIHYIKINRAFIGPGNSLQIAQVADSNYFTTVEATITEVGGAGQNRSWTLRDTLIDNKEPGGIWFAPTQKLYYFETPTNDPIDPEAIYNLNIVLNGGEFVVTGSTEIVNGMSSSLASQTQNFRFASNPAEYKVATVGVNTGNAYQVNTTLNVEWFEYINSSNIGTKSFDWNIGEVDVQPQSTQSFSANGETFYNLMVEGCSDSDPAVDMRRMSRITATITGAAEDLYNYILVNQPSSSLAQTKPTFTNLTATNEHPVIGIFSSRQTLIVEKPFVDSQGTAYIRCIDKKSTQELCQGPISGLLLFCSQHPGDNIVGLEEPFACN